MPLSRYDIADHLDIGLSKVKRVLALLSLSGVITTDGGRLQVRDLARLRAVAQVNPARLFLAPPGDALDEEDLITPADIEAPINLTTASGEPACFI